MAEPGLTRGTDPLRVRDPDLLAWCQRVPKVELHVHLEGAIPPATLLELIRRYEPGGEVADLDALLRRLTYRDFPHFIDVFVWKNGFLRALGDYALIAEGMARELAAQRVRYAEVFFSPTDAPDRSLDPQEIATAIRAGLDQVPDVEVALIADLVRDTGPERTLRTLEALAEVREPAGIAGITLGGSEADFPQELFTRTYDRARALGLRTTVHAGEGAGAGSVWQALRALRVERIGHGTRAIDDPELVEHLVRTQVPLESCPGSNVRTGVVPSIEQHPIRAFYDHGVKVTVNTDDPGMFHNTLSQEYALLVERLGFVKEDVRQLVLNAVDASFLAEERRRALAERIEGDPAWIA